NLQGDELTLLITKILELENLRQKLFTIVGVDGHWLALAVDARRFAVNEVSVFVFVVGKPIGELLHQLQPMLIIVRVNLFEEFAVKERIQFSFEVTSFFEPVI